MTVHAPSDVRAISIPVERGGCGQVHEAGELEPGGRFSIDCAACEPHIIASRTGWSHHPHGVALTPDEIGEMERAQEESQRRQALTWADPQAMAATFAAMMAGGQPAAAQVSPAPSLMEQIAALSAEERAALGAMLSASGPAAEVSTAPAAPVKAARRATKKAPPPATPLTGE